MFTVFSCFAVLPAFGHGVMSVFVEGCVTVVSYLLTFQSMAGVFSWCILISLNCCRSDVSHATGGLAGGYKVI